MVQPHSDTPLPPAPIILGGAPVDLARVRSAGVKSYTPAPGSIEVACSHCGLPMWQGPRQQEVKLAHPDAMAECFICIAKMAKATGLAPTVQNLGNNTSTYEMMDGVVDEVL